MEPLVTLVENCSECPARNHDFKGDAYCGHPSEFVPSVQWRGIPEGCPLRAAPLMVKLKGEST